MSARESDLLLVLHGKFLHHLSPHFDALGSLRSSHAIRAGVFLGVKVTQGFYDGPGPAQRAIGSSRWRCKQSWSLSPLPWLHHTAGMTSRSGPELAM
jgi:hypothetical protein